MSELAQKRPSAREKLLDAAVLLIRARGYAATSINALCRQAGVAKGAFFHHFDGKDALAVAAAEHWSTTTAALFAQAPYHAPEDPLDRVLGYLDFRKSLLVGAPEAFTCLVGTMVQETFATQPDIRDACEASISGHARTLEADIAAAMARHGVRDAGSPASLALHFQTVLQGGFILAKAKGDSAIAADAIDHLQRYVRLLFAPGRARPDASGLRPPDEEPSPP